MAIITESVGRPAHAEATFAELAHPDRDGEGERVAGARLLLGRRDNPDIVGKLPRDPFQHLEATGVHAIVVREKDPHMHGL
jgi:hypothetical protein